MFLQQLMRRVRHLLCRMLSFLSFGLIRLHGSVYLSDYYVDDEDVASPGGGQFRRSFSGGCVNGGSSDSESDATLPTDGRLPNTRRRRSQRSIHSRDSSASRTPPLLATRSTTGGSGGSVAIANDAVAHSYEDITRPDYHNYLWLSSQYDQTELSSAFYFLPNWVQHFERCKERDVDIDLVHETGSSHSSSNETSTNASTSLTSALFNRSKRTICRSFSDFLRRLSASPDSFFPKRRITLPKRQKTLVIDLDETLIHSTAASCVNFDFMIEVLISRTSCLYYVFKRPHLDYFLDVVSNWYNLVIYTASLREYADPVIDLIDDGRRYFKKRLFRNSCTHTPSQFFLKDLSLVDPDLSKLCLLDNSAASFALHPDNAIPIESWRDDRTDMALLELLPLLDALRFVEDVRSILSLRRLALYCNK